MSPWRRPPKAQQAVRDTRQRGAGAPTVHPLPTGQSPVNRAQTPPGRGSRREREPAALRRHRATAAVTRAQHHSASGAAPSCIRKTHNAYTKCPVCRNCITCTGTARPQGDSTVVREAPRLSSSRHHSSRPGPGLNRHTAQQPPQTPGTAPRTANTSSMVGHPRASEEQTLRCSRLSAFAASPRPRGAAGIVRWLAPSAGTTPGGFVVHPRADGPSSGPLGARPLQVHDVAAGRVTGRGLRSRSSDRLNSGLVGPGPSRTVLVRTTCGLKPGLQFH